MFSSNIRMLRNREGGWSGPARIGIVLSKCNGRREEQGKEEGSGGPRDRREAKTGEWKETDSEKAMEGNRLLP